MIDFGFSKLLLIAFVALMVIGPEQLPKIARLIGNFLGRVQRYIDQIKSEVNREIAALDQAAQIKTVLADVQQEARQLTDEFSHQLDYSDSSAAVSDVENLNRLTHTTLPRKIRKPFYPKKLRIQTQTCTARAYLQSGAARLRRHRPFLLSSQSVSK